MNPRHITILAVILSWSALVSSAVAPTLPVSPPDIPAPGQKAIAIGHTDLKEAENEIETVFGERMKDSGQSFKEHFGAITASEVPDDAPLQFNIVDGFRQGTISYKVPMKGKGTRVAPLPENNEKLFSADRVYGQPDINTYTITFSVTGTTTKTYKVKGVYGQGTSTLAVTFNEDGSAEIPAQKYITSNTTYGNIWFCPVDLATNTYSLTDPVICTRDEDGNWTMGAWALVVNHTTDKGYNGTVLFVSEKSSWLVPNMKAGFTTTDANGNEVENTFECAWLQDDNSGFYLLNMANTVYGRAINVRLTSEHNGIMSPQFVSAAGGYGNLYAYNADYATGQANSGKSAHCTVTDNNEVVFNDLIVATRSITSASNIRLAASPITYTLMGGPLSFPAPVTVDFEGKGTSADPYLIKNSEDIRIMAEAMSKSGYSTANYRLENNIDLSSLNLFTPVGDGEYPFNGNFDGNGKTLSGLTYNGYGFEYTGLFGVVGPQGQVKDLNIDTFTIYSAGANAGIVTAFNAGGRISGINVKRSVLSTQAEVAGVMAGMSIGSISDCRVEASVSGYGANGGIVGYNCGEIGNSHFSGQMSMSGALSTSYRHIAGIAAQNISSSSNGLKGNIHDCSVAGTITDNIGYAYIGGVVGVSHGSRTEDPAKIARCINTATLSSVGLDWATDPTLPKSYCGGVVAYMASTEMTDCANGGLIIESSQPKVFTGGVVGIASLSFISSGNDHKLGQMSNVSNCLSVGQIYSANGAGCGVYGAVPVLEPFTSEEAAAQIFTNCYADNQINIISTGDYGLPTSSLTSGSLPAGFIADIWSASSGKYPVPATLKATKPGILLSAPAILAKDENYSNVKKSISLPEVNSVEWAILGSNGNLVSSTPSLTISGGQATIGAEYGNNWLVASDGNLVKMIMVCVVPKVFDGSGTAADPFLIKSISDMAMLNNAIVNYGQSHLGDHFRMNADIDASADPEFVCVGYPAMTRPFNGTFDGDGHYFHNLTVKTAFRTTSGGVTANKSYQYGGLFSHVGQEGTIKNVRIAEDCVYDLYSISGSIAGISFGCIENCRNYAKIGANGMATGGIVGENDGVVVECYNAGDVIMQQNAVKTGAGGIAGANTGTIELCQNAAKIAVADGKTSEVFGGITAINYGTIDRSINLGEVVANVKAGGITATLGAYGTTGKISRSANFAAVTTVKDNTNGAVANEIRDNAVVDVVYDSSITSVGASLNSISGCIPATTHMLVGGEAPAGLPADMLDLKAGKYPVLSIFAEEPKTEALRSTYIDFSNSQTIANVGSDVAVKAAADVEWNLSESEYFSLSEGQIKVIIPEGDLSAKATATAKSGENVVKTLELTILPVLFEGEGSDEHPYLIKTKEDMALLQSFISKNAYDCLNMHYLLTDDLIYADADEFSPVGGDGTTKFNGTFDGNGKTISGIVYTSTTAKPGKNTGVFGQVGPQGVIHNLSVNNTLTGYGAGGVAAQLEGRIYDCTNRGEVIATGDPGGGIVGTLKAGASVENCRNLGHVMSGKTYGTGGIIGKSEAGSVVANCINKGALGGETQGKVLGGIAGMAAGSFSDCHNEGTLQSESASVGGIIGKHSAGALLEISGCTNTAAIYAPKAIAVAGIIGGNDSDKTNNKAQVHMTDCHNTAPVAGVLGVGGVAGIVSESDFIMDGCSNTGNIEAFNLGGKGYADTFAGGLAGCTNGTMVDGTESHIRNCSNSGKVTAWGGNNIGGLIGKNGTPVSNCYNTGDVTALFGGEDLTDLSGFVLSSIGGISGSAYGSVTDSWNSGNVLSDGCWIGGIAGYTNKDLIGCANIGDVTGKEGLIPGGSDPQAVGGIVGRMGSVSYAGFITDCYNTGNISGLTQVAGIVAQRFGNEVQLSNIYNTGDVTATAPGGTAYAIGNQRTEAAESLPADAHVYYLDGCCTPSSALDRAAIALDNEGLSVATLGERYISSPGALPVLKNLYEPALTYFEAIYGVVFEKENDTPDNVSGKVLYAALPGLEWTASDNIMLEDGVATPTEAGQGWLRVRIDSDSEEYKTFELRVISTGIDGIYDESDVVETVYFDLQGFMIAKPTAGTVCIERKLLSNGITHLRKVIIK